MTSRQIKHQLLKEESNPLTGRPYSKKYYQIQEKVTTYPAQLKKQEFLDFMAGHQIMLLTGETGSGKSTQIPKIMYEHFGFSETVVCIQPTRLTTRALAERVADELDVPVGSHVGYRYQDSEKEPGGDIIGLGKLIYITDGTFSNLLIRGRDNAISNQLSGPASLASYGAILVDEAHLRSTSMDVILYFIKRMLILAPEMKTKFVIMSATLDKNIFMDYFKKQGIGYMHIEGRTHPVKSIYLDRSIYENTDFGIYQRVPGVLRRVVGELFGLPPPERKDRQGNRRGDQRQQNNRRWDQQRQNNSRDNQQRRGDQQRNQRRDQKQRPWQSGPAVEDKPWLRKIAESRPYSEKEKESSSPYQQGGGRISYYATCTSNDWSPYDRFHDQSGNEELKGDWDFDIYQQFGGQSAETTESDESEVVSESEVISESEVVSESEVTTESEVVSESEVTTVSEPKFKKPEGDILIFLPSIAKIHEYVKMLTGFLSKAGVSNFRVVPLSSQSTDAEKEIAKYPIRGVTKVVLSTDIAETGLTIEGLVYVIDTGLKNLVSFRPVDRVTLSNITFISASASKQRMGRAGRIQPGTCYHLYTEKEFQAMRKANIPNIQKENIEQVLLQFIWELEGEGPNGVAALRREWAKLLSPPTKTDLDAYLKHFQKLKILEKGNISTLGECLMGVGLNVDMSYLLLTSSSYFMEPEMVADLVAMLEKSQGRATSFLATGDQLPTELRTMYTNSYGDLLGYYRIYLDYMDKKMPKDYRTLFRGELFQKVYELSEKINTEGPIWRYRVCQDLVPRKLSVTDDDGFEDFKRMMIQLFGHQVVLGKNMKYNPKRDNWFVPYEEEQKYLYLAKSEIYQLEEFRFGSFNYLFPLEDSHQKMVRNVSGKKKTTRESGEPEK